MVGINVPGLIPAQRFNSRLGGVEYTLRFGADEKVFAIGLVPDWRNFDSLGGEQLKSLQLGLGLLAEAIANAEGKSLQAQHE
jgi:hypothetical protein